MGKKILALFMLAMLIIPFSCSYDDTALWDSVNDLDDRVTNLESEVKKLNNNVQTLSDLMNGKLFIKDIEDKGDGVRVIHIINAAGEESTMVISNGADGKDGVNGADGKDGQNGADGKDGINGADGKDGQNGADGKDGKDGETPVVSVRQDSDGNWYWTVNGEYILDANGNKIRANGIDGADGKDGQNGADGKDGQDGKDGADGKDGINGTDGKDGQDGKDGADGQDGKDGKDGEDAIAPAFRINADGNWEMSLDQGMTWTVVGKATGKDGDAFFKDATKSADGKYAYLTLADGTVLTLAIYNQFGITFDLENKSLNEGETRDIAFTVTGMTPQADVEAFGKNGWEAEVTLNANGSGVITVTAPEKTGNGKVIVLLTDGADRTIMRTLSFVAGTVKASTTSSEFGSEGGVKTISVETNLDFTVQIPKDAQSWLSLAPESRAADPTRTETFALKVESTDSPSPRTALVSLVNAAGTVLETHLVIQNPMKLDETALIFRVDPATSTNSKGVIIPLAGWTATEAAPVTIDWGDGTEPTKLTSYTTAQRWPSHIYEDKGRSYNVSVNGNVTILTGTSASYMAGVTEIAQWGTGCAYTSIQIGHTTSPLTYLPGTKGNEFNKVTTIKFNNNKLLTRVDPDLLKGLTSAKSITSLFEGCESLRTLPSGLFKDCALVTTATYVFRYCYKLEELPEDLFEGLKAATSIDRIFYGCSSLKNFPANLFSPLGNVTNISYLFYGTPITGNELPEGLLQPFTKVTNLQYMFSNCKNLETVPAGFLQPLKDKVTYLNYMFENTPALKTLPADLFKGFTKVENVTYMFKSSGIVEIPAGFFDFAEKVTSFGNMFDACTKLQSIGSGFVNNFKDGYTGTSTFSFVAMFRDCESLTSLPVMFNEETWKRVSNFNTMFRNCVSLETIPADFFKGLGHGLKNNAIIKIENFNQVFDGCKKLKSVPMADIFNSPGGLLTTSFGSTFNGCESLTGTIPYYELEVGSAKYQVYPWQRKDYVANEDAEIKAAAQAVFGTNINYSSSNFVTGCTKLTGYATIPSTWGGANDGITAKPEIDIEVIHPEKREYYALAFDYHGKEVTTFYHYFATAATLKQVLPMCGNSLEQVLRERGQKQAADGYSSNFYACLNSEIGAGQIADDCDPETDYVLLILVENSKGQLIKRVDCKTAAVPTGGDIYESMLGTWTVTPAGTTTTVGWYDEEGNPHNYETPVKSFDINITPYRVDSIFTVSGWGYSLVADQARLRAYLNHETQAIEIWNTLAKGNTMIVQNYKFDKNDNPDALFSSYNAAYAGYVEDPVTENYTFWGGSTPECILAGNLIPGLDQILMLGQKCESASKDVDYDVYWQGFEATLGMGTMGYSQQWIPAQFLRPDCRFIDNDNVERTLHHYGPYTLARSNKAAAPRKAKAVNAENAGRAIELKIR